MKMHHCVHCHFSVPYHDSTPGNEVTIAALIGRHAGQSTMSLNFELWIGSPGSGSGRVRELVRAWAEV